MLHGVTIALRAEPRHDETTNREAIDGLISYGNIQVSSWRRLVASSPGPKASGEGGVQRECGRSPTWFSI
jgi:hypothetical protein